MTEAVLTISSKNYSSWSLRVELRNSCGARSNWTFAGYPACAALMVHKLTLISSNSIGPIMALAWRAADLTLEDVR
jgi:hypothetical protein